MQEETSITEKECTIVAKECRFAVSMPSYSRDIPDYHLVKEAIHYSDGSIKPNVSLVKNFPRSFFVTKPSYRNHEQKKESEQLDKLMRHECTQSELSMRVAQALGKGFMQRPMLNQLSASPYLYYSDVSSTSIIKRSYQKKYPDAASPYTVAYYDIETDVVHGTDDPVITVLVFGKKIYQTVLRSYLKGYSDPESRMRELTKKYLGSYYEKHGFELEIYIGDTTVDIIKAGIRKAHEWSPDFLAIWNLGFDIPRILDTFKKYNVDPKDVFSDPRVPEHLRFCKFKKGSTKKVTASGKVMPKNPSEQWHSLYCPAGFYVICAMASYRFVRQGEQELPYYKLDYVLNLNLGIRKLRFEEANHIPPDSLDWHEFMQEKYPLEYSVYNQFDCISMLELEEMNKDLSLKVPAINECTDFSRFNSQTKRFSDKHAFFLLEKEGLVIGTIAPKEQADPEAESDGDDDEDDDDENGPDLDVESATFDSAAYIETKNEVLSLKGWICTLPAHLSSPGRCLIKGAPSLRTLIRCFVYDSDAVSAYPSCTAVANVSRATTRREIIDIIGIDEAMFRRQNINLLQGHVNALEYCVEMYRLPKPKEALALFSDM